MSGDGQSTQDPALDRLQGWMQAVITHPGGIRSGVASGEARRSLDVDLPALEAVVTPSATLSGAERLAIYSRSYHARLLQCFQSMFPALLHALGEELFNSFAMDYLQRHPSHSYTLDQLADAFPQHLAQTRPDAAAAPDTRERWPDFIIDLAWLEWAFLKVYDGPGVEGQRLPDAQDIIAMPAEHLLAARPTPAPCLRLFVFRYPVHAYWLAVRRGQDPQLPAPAEHFVAMTRQNYRVVLHELSASQYTFLQALDGDHTVDQVLNRDAGAGNDRTPDIITVRDWLGDWAAKGFFANVNIEEYLPWQSRSSS
jgi:hypothetical protein